MPAYVIVDIDVFDVAGFDKYRSAVAPLIQKFGGKYIVRGGKTEVLEGDWKPNRVVVLEFPTMDRAKEWFNCDEYRSICEIRYRTAKTKIILVKGV